jgi:hypothetical protein
MTKNETERSFRYVGRASVVAGATRFEGAEEKTTGKIGVSCKPTTVEVTESGLDAGKLRIDALACAGLPHLGEDAVSYFKGPAPLALGTGLFLAIDDFGHGSPYIVLRKGI